MAEAYPTKSHFLEDYAQSPKLEIEFEYYWSQLSAGMEHLLPEAELDNLKTESLAKEVRFYEKVYRQVSDLAENTDSLVVCLFDVDGTIGEIKEEEHSNILHTLLRPAFTRVVGDLAVSYGDQVKFGLLSMRPESHLLEEMRNPTFLAPARAFMDETYIFSSEDLFKADPYINSGADETTAKQLHSGLSELLLRRCLSGLAGTVRQDLLKATCQGEIDLFDWYDPKLTILKGLATAEPETKFVIVDDLAYAECILDANEQLFGLGVRAEKQLLLPGCL